MAERLSINEAPSNNLQAEDGEYYFPAVLVRGEKDITPVKVPWQTIKESAIEGLPTFSPSLVTYGSSPSEPTVLRIAGTSRPERDDTPQRLKWVENNTLPAYGSAENVRLTVNGVVLTTPGVWKISLNVSFLFTSNTISGQFRWVVEIRTAGTDIDEIRTAGYIRPANGALNLQGFGFESSRILRTQRATNLSMSLRLRQITLGTIPPNSYATLTTTSGVADLPTLLTLEYLGA